MGFGEGESRGDDKDVGVDYYRITDVKRGEPQIIAKRSGKETVARFVAVGRGAAWKNEIRCFVALLAPAWKN
jgi:hypothetical protein